MSRFFDPQATPQGGLHAPATQRNKTVIADVLARHLPAQGLVLETASGTGEHVVHFAERFVALTFQPSDPDPRHLHSIEAWRTAAAFANVEPPLALDVTQPVWPIHKADVVLNINMIHISPWNACLSLLTGAGRVLPAGGMLFLYGPYKREGAHTAASNEAFDETLRRSDARWGVRDLEAVTDAAAECGLSLTDIVQMPANNFSLVFHRN